MNLFYRGLAAGACALGLVVLAADPGDLSAQPKKDAKVDPKKTEPKKVDPKKDAPAVDKGKTDEIGSFRTQDGLAIRRYWYSANKGTADAVLMFPAPGNKVNDTWISLAKAINKEGFSVMLFDWRGCGMNGPDRPGGPERVLERPEAWKNDIISNTVLKLTTVETKGLDWNKNMSGRLKDTVLYDLMAARFALDKLNDANQCNTNRIWLVSEGAGSHLALAWIAAESQRNTSYVKGNRFDDAPPPEMTPATFDYVGFVSLSYSPTSSTAPQVLSNGMPSSGRYTNQATAHMERRLGMVMIHSKKEGPSASKAVLSKYVATNDAAEMKKKFKYLKEIDTSAVPKDVKGIDLITPQDTFGTQAYIIEAMKGIRNASDVGKEWKQRDVANAPTDPPMFPIGKFKIR
jgi:hypothetical protein